MRKLYAFLILLVLFLSSADAQGAARNGRARVKHNADKNHVDTVPSLLYQHYFGNIMLMLHIRKNLSYLLPQMGKL